MKNKTIHTYQSLCTQFYDLEFAHRQSKKEALDAATLFILDRARSATGPILEPMCGSGRFMLPLLAAEFEVQGFDASPFMLASFAQKYALVSNKPAPIVQALLQDFTSTKQYGLIFIPFGSLGLVTNQTEVIQSLKNMYQMLKPGGTFMIEIDTIASLPQELGAQNRGTHQLDPNNSIALHTIESYNPKTQLFYAQCRYDLVTNGVVKTTETEDFYQYLYDFDEMDQLLKNAGFLNLKKYQNYDLEPAINQKTPILIYECKKD